MIGTMLTIAVCAIMIAASQAWWRSHINPVTLGVLVWLPALVMLNWPPFFLSPLYIHLNRPVSGLVYLALGMGFFSFWAGCACVKALSPPNAFTIQPSRLRLDINPSRLLILFGVGLVLFVYSYLRSGLFDMAYLDDTGVAAARVDLHLGLLSFLMFFLDIAAIGFFARFLQTGRKAYALPMLVAMLCYAVTLQKSPVVQLVVACLLLAALHPKASYHIFWRTMARRLGLIGLASIMLVGLTVMNEARGISVVQMTGASNPVLEQFYIYSGASAIMNISVTLEGYLPSDPPTMGLYLGRPILWHVLNHDLFVAARYFEGVNTGTYLIYGWVDFRWLGFIIMPFLTGAVTMFFLRAAMIGSLFRILLGVTAARALIFSTATDVIFDPTTLILLGVGLAAHFFAKSYRVQDPPRMAAPGAARMPRVAVDSRPFRNAENRIP